MTIEQADDNYLASLSGAEWFVIISRGALGFRYGPYSGHEAGAIMQRCVGEGIPCILSASCGREFDWDVARDFGRGQPADWKPMEEAPQDGSTIMADVGGIETRVIWWNSWDWWRELNEDGSVGKPVDPVRWRVLSDEEKGRG